ncbi:hypothetical protein LEP1GSC196_2305 [Leptospira meyeri serovar Semaranga str. Veldrot Semarang 173]|nr:hypothetical protein LEP1GSC196_2305 [Leptospira meyeri serovar Semaranga str. Veldrot Semarang 173]
MKYVAIFRLTNMNITIIYSFLPRTGGFKFIALNHSFFN